MSSRSYKSTHRLKEPTQLWLNSLRKSSPISQQGKSGIKSWSNWLIPNILWSMIWSPTLWSRIQSRKKTSSYLESWVPNPRSEHSYFEISSSPNSTVEFWKVSIPLFSLGTKKRSRRTAGLSILLLSASLSPPRCTTETHCKAHLTQTDKKILDLMLTQLQESIHNL